MTRTIRILGIAALALALGALAGPGSAGAQIKKKKFHGSVTIAYEKNAAPGGTDRFYGVVSSPKARCARGAVVNLGYKPAFEGGGGSDIPRTTVGSARADASGNWEILYEVTPTPTADFASFSASSPKRVLKTKNPDVRLVCKFATSPVITLFPG
jgi:hypothetical protein